MASIYLRGKTYWARAQRAGQDIRESLKTRNKRVAEKRLEAWKDKLDLIVWGDRPRVTFAEAQKQFRNEHLLTLKEGAGDRYAISLGWLVEHMGTLFLDEITRETLSSFETWRRTMPSRASRPDGAKVSSPTIRRDLMCLSSLFSFCEDREWIPDGKNPVPGYLKRRARRGLKEAPPRTRYLSYDEEAALLHHATEGVREAIMLAIDTGLREQEMFSLTWAQVDLAKGLITTTSDTKSKRVRQVPIGTNSAHFLAEWKSARLRSKVVHPNVFHHADSGKRFVNLTKGFKAAARRAKITDIRWHDLRRTAGCRWRQRDKVSLEKVSILLGHSSYAVTEKCYAFLNHEQVASDVAAQFSQHGTADNLEKVSKINV